MVDISNYFLWFTNQLITGEAPPCANKQIVSWLVQLAIDSKIIKYKYIYIYTY